MTRKLWEWIVAGSVCFALSGVPGIQAQDGAPADEEAAPLPQTVVEAESEPEEAAPPPPRPRPAPAPVAAPDPEPAPLVIDDDFDEASPVATESFYSLKTDTPLIETPQSVSVVNSEELAMRGARNLNEALSYSAGIVSQTYGLDSRVDDILIRGFDASTFAASSSSNYLDGMRLVTGDMWTTPSLDVFGMERVEVLKGPSAVLYGQVAPGGLVNRVTKRPLPRSRNEFGYSYNNLDSHRITFDTTGPVGGGAPSSIGAGKGGKQIVDPDSSARYRLVAAYQNGGTQVDHTDIEKLYLAPSIEFDLGPDTHFTLYSVYQRDEGGSTYQFRPLSGTLLPNPFGRIGLGTFLGEPDFNTFDRTQFFAGYEFDHRLNDAWSLQHNLRYSYIDTFYETVVGNPAGADPGTGLQPDNRTFGRRAVDGAGDASNVTIDTRLTGEFDTGAVEHTLLFGYDYIHRERAHLRRFATAPVPGIDIFDPVYSGTAFASSLSPQIDSAGEGSQHGIYLQDQLVLGGLHATLGGRYDITEDDSTEALFGGAPARNLSDPSDFTGRAGLLYLFDNGVAPYASYATSFEPVLGTDAYGTPYVPTTGKQHEVGVKYEPESIDALFTLAYFDLTQQNVLTADPNPPAFDPFNQIQTGEISIQGFEFESRAELAEGLHLIGNLTWLDSEIIRSNDGYAGNQFGATPGFLGSGWLDYTFPDGTPLAGLGLGIGVRHVGERFGSEANQFLVPAYTVIDAAVRYDLGELGPGLEGARLNLNIGNLEDKLYVANASHPISSHYGSGRIVTLGCTFEW